MPEKENRTGKVLVLGSDNRSFLTVIRSLGRRRLRLHVGWCSPRSSALHSKYIDTVHEIPPYSPGDDSWKRALVSLAKDERFDLIIPCDDPTLIPLQRHRADLEPHARIYLLHHSTFEIAFDKFKANELARSIGIPVPNEMRVSDPAKAEIVLSKYRLPVVLKPRSSFTEDNLTRKRPVLKAYTPQEFYRHLAHLLEEGDVLVQENFVGTGVGVELLADRGEILLAFQHIRIHEPIMGGGSTYRKSAPLDSDLLGASRKLLKALDYTGVAMVEFKVNFDAGAWIFVEINGRFWGSLPLAVSAGADFPYYLYQLLVHGRREFPQDYKKGLYCRNFLNDVEWLRENLKADRSDATLATRPLWKIALEIFNVLTFRERSDTFVIDDPQPGFVELAGLLRRLWLGTVRRIRTRVSALPPVRKRRADEARSALRRAKSILFACKGNICRSPFAQHYARTIFPDSVKILSCGYYPEAGRICPAEAVDVAKEMGIDLESHRSCIVDEEMMRQAEIVFTFDEENYRTLAQRFPFAKRKIYRLGSLAREGTMAIGDPYGRSIDVFRTTYRAITKILNGSIPRA